MLMKLRFFFSLLLLLLLLFGRARAVGRNVGRFPVIS